MFRLWYTAEVPKKGKITFKHFPILGNQPDVNGRVWRVSSIHDNWVNACPVGPIMRDWEPYYYEIQEEKIQM